MNTATLIKNLDGWSGDARLFKLEPPMETAEPPMETAEFVVVSATVAMFSGPETYIFKADKDGNAESFGELDGSYRGGLDHAKALRNAGYEIV